MKKFDIDMVRDFICNTSADTCIYLGADSRRYCGKDNNWYADYTLAIVVHYDGCRGCKVFGYMETERDFDQRKEGSKTRSELYVEDRNTFRDAIGIPGSLSSTPPNPPINPAATERSCAKKSPRPFLEVR